MPTVPTVQGRQVESRGVSSPGFQTFEQPNIGDALVNVGSQALDVFGQAKQQADLALTQDATQRLYAVGSGLMDDPKEGLMTLQGKNAIGQAPGYIQKFDNEMQTIAGTLPESARNVFLKHAQQQRMQFATQAERHELGQRRQYESGQQDGYLSLQAQQAISNPQLFNQSALNARASIMAYGQAHGQSPEEIEANWGGWREQAANRASEAWYNPIYQQMMGPEGKIEVTNTPQEAQLFSSIIWQESGGNQFGKDGAPLVSPKGAVGAAQVMESTGPEAASLAGLPWDRDKWLNDPRYNVQLGKAYFGAQLKKYDNNPVLAVAAYNAGPGAVDGWIQQFGDPRDGTVSNAQFAAAIPYEETRNYVAKVTGSAGSIPGNATIENLVNQPFWNAMSPQKKSVMLSKQAGLYDMQAAAGRVSLQTRMQDDLAKLEAGQEVNPITEHEWAAVMPLQASPSERIQLQQSFEQYQQAMTLQPVYKTIVQGSAQQSITAVQAMMPKESDVDFKFKQGLYSTAQAKLNATLKARESDPGTWLQTNSPVAKNAFEQYQNNQASGEYLVSRLEAEKGRLGINSKKVLPDSMVNNLISQIDNNKESSVTAIQSVAQSFGKYSDQVMRQVQNKAFPALKVVMSTENQRAADALWQIRNVSTSDLRSGLDKNKADSADSLWTDQFKDFSSTLIPQRNGAENWTIYNEQGKRLTYNYMQRGMSPGDAAKQAYQDVLGQQYQTNGTWRLPNRAGVDIHDVTDGANEYLKSLSPESIMPLIGDPRLPDSVNREQSLSRIRDNAQWVTNSDESGLTLMMNGLLINNAQGQPITVTFADLAKIGAGNRTTWNSLTKFVQTPVKYTPGQSKNYTVESQRENLINIIQHGQQAGR
ncbi:transglycosylase SLT domain-containing protein [Klebsiella sp. I138]|uniref:transglycosylase SLT domain-containing protein n=1 Tax=Klebsiella sp. I138 TaxID=2755385 RepID=UPI003DA9B87E